MYFIYIDDSGEKGISIYTAIAIPSSKWKAAFKLVRNYRRGLKSRFGIPIYKELHSWTLVSGRGRISPSRTIPKATRLKIFNELLQLLSTLPGVMIFPACNPNDSWCFERLLNRIQATIKDINQHAIIFSDHGKDNILKKIRRKMNIYNAIPSNKNISAVWPTGKAHKNIPIENIIEDIVYKDSAHCCFIQLADACAYALLRKERKMESKKELAESFNILTNSNALVLKNKNIYQDGIIR